MKVLTLSRPSDWALPLLAIIVLVLGGVSYNVDRRLPPPVWEGRDLVPGLDPDRILKVSIIPQNGKEIILTRQGRAFFVESADRAPADPEKVNEFFLRLGGAQIARSLGSKSDWKKYELDKPRFKVVLEGANKAHWELLFGKSMPSLSGTPVRIEGKDEIFVTTEHLWLGQDLDLYVNKTAFNLNPQKVQQLEVKFQDKALPEDKFLKQELLMTFSPLKVSKHFRTGSKHQDLEKVQWNWESVLKYEDGTTYNIFLGYKDQRWFARAQASLAQTSVDEGVVLDINALATRSTVERFNQEKLPWVWEIAAESVENLKKGLQLN